MLRFLTSFAIFVILFINTNSFCYANAQDINVQAKMYAQQGTNALKDKRYDDAIINFKKAFELKPDNYAIMCALGISYLYKGDLKQGEGYLLLATKTNSKEWFAYANLGDLKRAQGLPPFAVDYYNKALNIPSIPESKKTEIQKSLQTCIEEQKTREASIKTPEGKWITMDCGNIWKRVYFKGNNQHWIMTHSYMGEDAVNYKWTKIITIAFYDKNTYNFALDDIFNKMTNFIKQSAKQLAGEAIIQKISSNENELIFESKITDHGQSTICRIFKGKKGFYTATFEHKKENFTPLERTEAIKILKSVEEI